VADAGKQLDTDAANALEQLTNKLAEIGADKVMAAAEGELNQAITAAINETVDFDSGVTNPANPEKPQLPSVYSHAVDAGTGRGHSPKIVIAYHARARRMGVP
jgi:hypothetical protein